MKEFKKTFTLFISSLMLLCNLGLQPIVAEDNTDYTTQGTQDETIEVVETNQETTVVDNSTLEDVPVSDSNAETAQGTQNTENTEATGNQEETTIEEVVEETTNEATDTITEEVIEEEQVQEEEVVEEISYPAFSESKTIDDVRITVEAQEGVFPEGVTLSVEKVAVYVEQQVTEAIDQVRDEDKKVVASYTFDIKVLDKDGNEIQPKDMNKVKVSFEMVEVQNDNLTTEVYHIDDKQNEITAEQVTQLEAVTEEKIVSVETDGFSLYTVEFTYNNKQYVLQGNSAIKLNELLASVELTGNVESWEISNTEFFNIFKGTSQDISYTYSNIEDEAIEAYGIPANNPDGDTLWMVALKPFTTNECLKITIDGIEYQIDVTDSYTDPLTNNDLSDRVIQDGDINNFTSSMPLATIFIDEDVINMDLWRNPNYNDSIHPEILYTGTNGTFGVINQDFYEYPESPGVGRTNIDWPTQDDATFDGFSKHEFVLDVGTIKAGQDNKFDGPVMRYTIDNAAEYTGSDGITRKGNVVITYSNLNLVIESGHSDIVLQPGYPIALWDTNKFYAGITSAHGNTRMGITVDVNVKVVDQNGQTIDGNFLYPVVDVDIDRSTNTNFGRLHGASDTRNYSEQIELTSGYIDKIWIPNSFVEGITTSDGTPTGTLRIFPSTNDNNTFNSGFITLANNTTGGINTKIISDSAIGSASAYGGVESYILTGSSKVNIKVAESTDEGGKISASSKDYAENIKPEDVNRKKIITAAKGQTVQFTMTPNPGYKIKNIYVSNSDLNVLDNVQSSGAAPISMSDPNLVEMPGGIYYYFMESIQNEQSIHVEWEPSKLEVTKTVTDANDIPSADFDFRLSLDIPDTTGAAKAYVKVFNTHPVPATYRMNHDFLLYDAQNDVYLGYDGTGLLRDIDTSDLLNTDVSNISKEYWWYIEEIESVDSQTGEQIFIPVIFDKVTDDFMVYDLTTKEISMVSTMPSNAGYVLPLSSGTNTPSISWNGSAYLYNEDSVLPSGYSPISWYKMEEFEAGNYTVALNNGTTQAVSEIESYLSTNSIPYERYEYTLSSDENDIDDVDNLVMAWNNRQKQNDAQVVQIKANIDLVQDAIDNLDPTSATFEQDLATLQSDKAAYELALQDRLAELPDILKKITGEHGKYEFTLSYVNGEPMPSYTFDGVVPFGWGYKVEELDRHGSVVNLTNDFEADDSGVVWKLDNIIGEDRGTLNADKSVEFVNDAKKNSITVTKNTIEPTSETFTFQIKAYIDGLPRIYYDFSSQGATAKPSHFYEFTLGDNESKTFIDIPVGYVYEVHELTKAGWKLVNITSETSSEYTLNKAGRYKVEVEDLDLTNVTVTTEDNINVYYKSYTVTNNDTGESNTTKEIIARTAADDALLQQYFPAYQSILDTARYAVTATSTETTLGNRVFVNAHTTDNGGTTYHSGNVNATSTSTTTQAVPGVRGKDPITFGTLSYSSTGSVQTNANGTTKTPDNSGTSGFNFQGQTDDGVSYMRLRYNTDGKTNQFTSSNHTVSYGDSFKFAYPGAATLEDGTVADVYVELSDINIYTPNNSMNMNFKGSIFRFDGEPTFALKSLGTATPREYTVNAKVKVTVNGATEHDTYKVTFDGTDYSGDGANPVEFNASVTNTNSSSWVFEPITLSGGDYEAGTPGTPSYTHTTVTSSPFLLTVRNTSQQQVATLIGTDTYEVNLPAGASITIPDGKTYKIYEDNGNDGWTLIKSSSDSTTSVNNPAVPMTLDILDNDVDVTFTNEIKKHDLTITKETINDDEGTFNFVLVIYGETQFFKADIERHSWSHISNGYLEDYSCSFENPKLRYIPGLEFINNRQGDDYPHYRIAEYFDGIDGGFVWTGGDGGGQYNANDFFFGESSVYEFTPTGIYSNGNVMIRPERVKDTYTFAAKAFNSYDIDTQSYTYEIYESKYDPYADNKFFSNDLGFEAHLNEFTLNNGDSLTIPNIPYGYNYEVYEVDSQGNKVLVGSNIGSTDWKLKSIDGNNTGTITDDTSVTFTNELVHDLTIKKETTDSTEGSFNFRIKFWFENEPITQNSITVNTNFVRTNANTPVTLSSDASLYNYYDGELTYELYKGSDITTATLVETSSSLPGAGWTYDSTSNSFSYSFSNIEEGENYIVKAPDGDVKVYIDGSDTIISSPYNWTDYVPDNVKNASSGGTVSFTHEVDVVSSMALPGNELVNTLSNMFEFNKVYAEETTTNETAFDPDSDDLPNGYSINKVSDGTYSFTLTNSQSINFKNLPHGVKYEVYEETKDGWKLVDIDGDNPTVSKGAGGISGTLNGDTSHTFSNMPLYDLKVTKRVEGNMGDKFRKFEFNIKISKTEQTKHYASDHVEYYGSVFELARYDSLGGGSTAYADTRNIIPEVYNDFLDPNNAGSSNKFETFVRGLPKLEETDIKWIDFGTEKNAKLYRTHLDGYDCDIVEYNNNLYEAFIVEGNILRSSTDTSLALVYVKYTLEDAEVPLDLTDYGGVSNGDGSYKFTLSHGESINLENIPVGYTYEVIEKDYSSEGYKTYTDLDTFNQNREISGTLDADKSHTFRNVNTAAVPTEIRVRNTVLTTAVLVALASVYFVLQRKKRNKEQD